MFVVECVEVPQRISTGEAELSFVANPVELSSKASVFVKVESEFGFHDSEVRQRVYVRQRVVFCARRRCLKFVNYLA